MMHYGWVQCSVPVLVLFMHAAVVTFIGSHHTVSSDGKQGGKGAGPEGTAHLQHHLHFNVNYGNFSLFDTIAGTAK